MSLEFGRHLYNDLMNLVNEQDSPFYFVDHMLDGVHYRVFNYRLASYSDFIKPGGLECRGHMFELKNGEYDSLAALPPRKFFNYRENPLVMDIDYNGTTLIMDKMDGSLMTTFWHDGKVLLKSKTSLSSEQGIAANEFLNREENKVLYDFLFTLIREGISVSLEWTSPIHRIVIGYDKPGLTVLGARDLITGNNVDYEILHADLIDYGIGHLMVKNHLEGDMVNGVPVKEWVESIASMTGNIEGYVIEVDRKILTKHKTDKYCSLHHTKDSVNSDRRLFEAVVNEAHDDLRAMFADDTYALGRIDEMETKVKRIYREYVDVAVQYVNDNREKDRKTFAIDGQKDLPKMLFGITMSLYLGKPVDFKEWLIKNFKDFGIKDDAVQTTSSDEDE